mgnify:CR=1 FL=1
MKFVKVRYGYGSLGKNSGCDKTPNILVKELSFNSKIDVEDVEIDNFNVDQTMKNISNVEGDFFLGGDHSITYGSYKGFAKKFYFELLGSKLSGFPPLSGRVLLRFFDKRRGFDKSVVLLWRHSKHSHMRLFRIMNFHNPALF